MFNAEDHPRAPKGADTGGQFAAGGGEKKSPPAKTSKPTKATGHSKPTGSKRPDPDSGPNLYYDAGSNTGTGYGKSDPRVRGLQTALNRLGLADAAGKKLRVDGELGPKTTAAVKAAQKRLGVKADGIVTPALLKQLTSAKAPSKPRKRSLMTATCVRAFDFETRATGDGRTLEGYAAVFGSKTSIRDMQGEFDEVIAPGAFARSLSERMPVLQFDHGKDPRVGTVPIGAIQELNEDARGLFVRARLFDNQVVEPVRQAIEGKAIRGMSFRFLVPEGGDTWTRNGTRDHREIRDADVFELGPVVHPAYDSTTVGVRSLLAQLDPDDFRALMREVLEEIRDSGIDLDSLPILTGRPDVESGGGDSDELPRSGDASTLLTRSRADEEALRLRGILK